MFHHPQNIQQSFISFGDYFHLAGAKGGQCPTDKMGQGKADGNLAIMFFRCGFNDEQSHLGQKSFNFFEKRGRNPHWTQNYFTSLQAMGGTVGTEQGMCGQEGYLLGQ